MIFNTWSYAVFLAVAFGVYWTVPRAARALVLTAFGFVFYAWYHPPHVLLIAVSIPTVAFVAARGATASGGRRRWWLGGGIGACLGALAFCKYQGFAVDVLQRVLAVPGVSLDLQPIPVRPPLAISFFVFEYVHYLIEIGRGTFGPARLRELAVFIMFFPTLICGPIKRYQQFDPDEAGARFDAAAVSAGLERILFGLAKKTLVADTVAPLCTPVLEHPGLYGTATLWLAVYGFAIQIYADFSGYSDIAIGTARLFGYRVPENFAYPYLQPNIAGFWRCWHMSLTSWITDYVYIPLGGNRRGEGRAAWNRVVSMTLCGLWHGAALHFAVWGLYHGLALNAYRGWQRLRPRVLGSWTGGAAGRVCATVFTFHVVCFGWVLFVCDFQRATIVVPRLLGLR